MVGELSDELRYAYNINEVMFFAIFHVNVCFFHLSIFWQTAPLCVCVCVCGLLASKILHFHDVDFFLLRFVLSEQDIGDLVHVTEQSNVDPRWSLVLLLACSDWVMALLTDVKGLPLYINELFYEMYSALFRLPPSCGHPWLKWNYRTVCSSFAVEGYK